MIDENGIIWAYPMVSRRHLYKNGYHEIIEMAHCQAVDQITLEASSCCMGLQTVPKESDTEGDAVMRLSNKYRQICQQ